MTATIEDFATAKKAILQARAGHEPAPPLDGVIVSDEDGGFAMVSFDLAPSSPGGDKAEQILDAVRQALTRAHLRDPAFLE